MKLVQFANEADKPILVNADAVCFFQRIAQDRVELLFIGETRTVVRGTVEFVKIKLEGQIDHSNSESQRSSVQDNSLAREN